jgi:hypothetical protein
MQRVAPLFGFRGYEWRQFRIECLLTHLSPLAQCCVLEQRDLLASVDCPFVTGLQLAFQTEAEVFLALELKTGEARQTR